MYAMILALLEHILSSSQPGLHVIQPQINTYTNKNQTDYLQLTDIICLSNSSTLEMEAEDQELQNNSRSIVIKTTSVLNPNTWGTVPYHN